VGDDPGVEKTAEGEHQGMPAEIDAEAYGDQTEIESWGPRGLGAQPPVDRASYQQECQQPGQKWPWPGRV